MKKSKFLPLVFALAVLITSVMVAAQGEPIQNRRALEQKDIGNDDPLPIGGPGGPSRKCGGSYREDLYHFLT